MTGVSISFCSRSFRPIRCNFVAAFSGRTAAAVLVQKVMLHRMLVRIAHRGGSPAAVPLSTGVTACRRSLRSKRRCARRVDFLRRLEDARHPRGAGSAAWRAGDFQLGGRLLGRGAVGQYRSCGEWIRKIISSISAACRVIPERTLLARVHPASSASPAAVRLRTRERLVGAILDDSPARPSRGYSNCGLRLSGKP